jgi:hypothetical protein
MSVRPRSKGWRAGVRAHPSWLAHLHRTIRSSHVQVPEEWRPADVFGSVFMGREVAALLVIQRDPLSVLVTG